MLPPQRSSRSRACLTTSTVSRLRNASVPSSQHRLRMSCQEFDEITPECHVNPSIKAELTAIVVSHVEKRQEPRNCPRRV